MATAKKILKYTEGVGRRKTSVARVRLYDGGKANIVVNGKPFEEYFKTSASQNTVREALKLIGVSSKVRMTVRVNGGGIQSQAGAVRHGTARALQKQDPERRAQLKTAGFLTRDGRMKERRKFGLKKARKAAQWSKR